MVLSVFLFSFVSFVSADTDNDIPVRNPSRNATADILNYVNRLVKEEKDFRVESQKKLESKMEKIHTECSANVADSKLLLYLRLCW